MMVHDDGLWRAYKRKGVLNQGRQVLVRQRDKESSTIMTQMKRRSSLEEPSFSTLGGLVLPRGGGFDGQSQTNFSWEDFGLV
jgi:hypothetical protein